MPAMHVRPLALVLALVLTALPRVRATAAPVDPSVVSDAHGEDGRVRVVVALQPAPYGSTAADLAARRTDIVRRRRGLLERLRARINESDVAVHRRFSVAAGFTASVTATGLAALADDPEVARIEVEQYGGAALDQSVRQIGADVVHAFGVGGNGVTVAVLDTGIDTTHPDLESRILAEECFCTGCCPGRRNRASGPGAATGRSHAHGTHVTGILVSQGNHRLASIGVAPQAQVLAIRVLNDQARGALSDWVAALDWLVARAATFDPPVRVVNMSLASDFVYEPDCDEQSAFNVLFGETIAALRARGVLVFAAAGNSENATMLSAPACVRRAAAVGAVDRGDVVAEFSNSGATLALLAPGVGIRSTVPTNATGVLTGTSMATPHAAGAAALLWSGDPVLSPEHVLNYLRDAGVPLTDARNQLRFPRVDVFAAYEKLRSDGDLIQGGGSRLSDCLVEWQFTPRSMVRRRARPLAYCQDGDPTCDRDEVSGQCTFDLSLCFNVRDGRVPFCRVNDPITRVSLTAPRLDTPDPVDAGNAAAMSEMLPPVPLTGERVCTGPTHITVPIGPSGRGMRSLRLAAESLDRRDADRAYLVCLGGPGR
jgi:hypothetical protein